MKLLLKWKCVALVQRVAPILFCSIQLPEKSFATSNLASYPTPQASTSTMYSWNCYTVMGRFNRSELILNRLLCIIVASSPGVSFLFPERGSRLLPFVGLLLAVVGSFLSSQPEGWVPSVALLLQSHSSFYKISDKKLVNGKLCFFWAFFPELWISTSSH